MNGDRAIISMYARALFLLSAIITNGYSSHSKMATNLEEIAITRLAVTGQLSAIMTLKDIRFPIISLRVQWISTLSDFPKWRNRCKPLSFFSEWVECWVGRTKTGESLPYSCVKLLSIFGIAAKFEWIPSTSNLFQWGRLKLISFF